MNELHTYLESLYLLEGQRYRGDCPSCGKHNTFGVEKIHGDIVYNCFSNSCNLSGKKSGRRDIETIKSTILAGKVNREDTPYATPTGLITGASTAEAVEWLQKHNAYSSYQQGLYDVYTDIRQERIVVPITSPSGVVVNFGGRAWSRYTKPKFKFYNSGGAVYPFVVRNGGIAVLVEDFASAAAVASDSLFTGVALLGTHANPKVIIEVLTNLKPDRVIVALDKDATRKAIKLKNFLQFIFKDVIIHPLQKDIKDMTEDELVHTLERMSHER